MIFLFQHLLNKKIRDTISIFDILFENVQIINTGYRIPQNLNILKITISDLINKNIEYLATLEQSDVGQMHWP